MGAIFMVKLGAVWILLAGGEKIPRFYWLAGRKILDLIGWRGEKSAISLPGGEKNLRFHWLAGRKIRNFIGWRGEKSSISLAGGEKNPRFLLDGGEKNSQTKCVDTKFGPKKKTY